MAIFTFPHALPELSSVCRGVKKKKSGYTALILSFTADAPISERVTPHLSCTLSCTLCCSCYVRLLSRFHSLGGVVRTIEALALELDRDSREHLAQLLFMAVRAYGEGRIFKRLFLSKVIAAVLATVMIGWHENPFFSTSVEDTSSSAEFLMSR